MKIELNTNVPLNEKGTNANIKFHIVDNKIMKEENIRYIENTKTYIYDVYIPILSELSLYMTFNTEKNLLSIMVLDNDFCQPYDYEAFILDDLEKGESPRKEHLQIKEFVENKLLHLQEVGILSGYKKNDYI